MSKSLKIALFFAAQIAIFGLIFPWMFHHDNIRLGILALAVLWADMAWLCILVRNTIFNNNLSERQ